MHNIKPENLVSKTDKLLFSILLELKQLNESLHPIAKDTETKGGSKRGISNKRTTQNP